MDQNPAPSNQPNPATVPAQPAVTNSAAPVAAPVPPTANQASQANPAPQAGSRDVPAYRQYWIFGIIFLFLPIIIGLILLFTGDVYKKVNNVWTPISRREKITLIVIAILLQGGYLLRYLR
jgi:hypothetical protein